MTTKQLVALVLVIIALGAILTMVIYGTPLATPVFN